METQESKSRLKREGPSWAASIGLHLGILLVLSMIPYLAKVFRQQTSDAAIRLQPPAGASMTGVDDPGGAPGGNVDEPRPLLPSESYAKAPHVEAPPAAAMQRLAAQLPAPELPSRAFVGSGDPSSKLMEELAAISRTADSTGGGGLNALLTGTSKGFGVHIGNLRGQGLDIVLTLDATDSMSPYIEQAKKRLHEILDVVTGLVPNARFGVVAFKDYGDDYGPNAVKALRLTADVKAVRKFIDEIVAGGGADLPEPIHEALAVATNYRSIGWHAGRKWVIILVGDSTIHASGRKKAFELARKFAGRAKGTINVIDVGGTGRPGAMRRTIQPDLKQIAVEGRGSAFLLTDEKQFWRYLIVSVFGKRYQQDVDVIIRKFVRSK